MTNSIIFAIKLYKRTISPLLERVFGTGCRFTPTCSEYSIQAFQKFGFIKGLSFSLQRITQCHPFSKHPYYFPVSERK
jgi:putative membrane protein insertion efficiency factor